MHNPALYVTLSALYARRYINAAAFTQPSPPSQQHILEQVPRLASGLESEGLAFRVWGSGVRGQGSGVRGQGPGPHFKPKTLDILDP
eukprot:1259909-Rhodomonas_salina.1